MAFFPVFSAPSHYLWQFLYFLPQGFFTLHVWFLVCSCSMGMDKWENIPLLKDEEWITMKDDEVAGIEVF